MIHQYFGTQLSTAPSPHNINNNGCYRGRRESILNISVANLVIHHLHHSTSWIARSVRQLFKWVTERDFGLINKFSTDSRRHLPSASTEKGNVPSSSYPSIFWMVGSFPSGIVASHSLHCCQLLCFWRLALCIVVEVFQRTFSRKLLLQGCLLQTRYA